MGKEALMKGRSSNRLLNRYGDEEVEAGGLEAVPRVPEVQTIEARVICQNVGVMIGGLTGR